MSEQDGGLVVVDLVVGCGYAPSPESIIVVEACGYQFRTSYEFSSSDVAAQLTDPDVRAAWFTACFRMTSVAEAMVADVSFKTLPAEVREGMVMARLTEMCQVARASGVACVVIAEAPADTTGARRCLGVLVDEDRGLPPDFMMGLAGFFGIPPEAVVPRLLAEHDMNAVRDAVGSAGIAVASPTQGDDDDA